MGIVTYIPRSLPLVFLARRRLPRWLIDWLGLIPVAILSALVAPILFINDDLRTFDLTTPELLVAVPTFLFAWKTKSLGGTVLVGMALYWAAGVISW